MVQILLTTILFIGLVRSCSVTPDWEASTLEDQIKYAGAIIKGTVDEIQGDVNSSSVILKDTIFYRGAGPSVVKVSGFTNSAMCGVAPSEVGTDVIVFVCREDQNWILSKINLFTGAVSADQSNMEILEAETEDEYRFEDASFIKYKKCSKPPGAPFPSQQISIEPPKRKVDDFIWPENLRNYVPSARRRRSQEQTDPAENQSAQRQENNRNMLRYLNNNSDNSNRRSFRQSLLDFEPTRRY